MILLKFRHTLIFFSLILFFSGCGSQSGGSSSGSGHNASLPKARGDNSEVIIAMDTNQWKSELGKELRLIFQQSMPGMPQDEPYFNLKVVNPREFNSILKRSKNIIFVTTLENRSQASQQVQNYFTKESLEQIKNNPDLFSYVEDNVFANQQQVMYLFGKDEETLVNNLRGNAGKLRQPFLDAELQRITQNIYQTNKEKTVGQNILQKHGFSFKVPYGYEIAKNLDSFIWFREFGQRKDKNFYVSYEDYTNPEVFSGQDILARRDSLGKKYLADDSTAYMTTQAIVPITTDTVQFNNRFAVKARGLWKLSNNTMGGPFVSYTFVDEEQQRLYYLEGFVYAPASNKRNLLREVVAIMNTFKTSSDEQGGVAKK